MNCPTQSPPYRIMIVDDNEDTTECLEALLNSFGYQIRVANDGRQALSTAETFKPHVALLDLCLPAMSGTEIARGLRKQPWGEEMTLIVFSGLDASGSAEECYRAGVDHYLVKPVQPDKLKTLLEKICGTMAASPR